jgi:hypothetical protein
MQSNKARRGSPPPPQTDKSAAFPKRDCSTTQTPLGKTSKADQDYILSGVGSQFDAIGTCLGHGALTHLAICEACSQLMLILILQTFKLQTRISS